MSVPRPMYRNTIGSCLVLEFNQILGEIRKRVLLDLRRKGPQLFPFRDLLRRSVAPHSHHPKQFVEAFFMNCVREERFSILGLVIWAHNYTPFRISAI